ncbi:MAG: hypothetical protein FD123_2210 [Bacteroidetes bacterium]|nr:MAG: hypothetical protein FD123_2210 [Bacteroidota bacterium]
MRQKIFFSFIILLLAVSAQAEPMHIYFQEMITQAKTIVIAEYIGPANSAEGLDATEWNIDVKEVLKGKAGQGRMKVGRAHGMVQLPAHSQCIAFLNERNEFEWAGYTKDKGDPASGIIFLEGFYDFNAYLVSPCTITLNQLKEYLKKGFYHCTVSGDLHFFSQEKQVMEPSTVHFEITYTFGKKTPGTKVKMTGMKLVDFPKEPEVELGSWRNTIELDYEPNMVRPLKIHGEILDSLGLDSSGFGYKALFWSDAPEELTEKEFFDYLADPKVGGNVAYDVELITKKKTYLLKLREEYGRIGYLEGFGNGRLECWSLGSPEPDRKSTITLAYDTLGPFIELDMREPDKKKLRYSSERFLRELKIKPMTGTFVYREGDVVHREACTLKYKSRRFMPNPNYKGK